MNQLLGKPLAFGDVEQIKELKKLNKIEEEKELIKDSPCQECDGEGTQEVECFECEGHGFLEEDCNECNGKGFKKLID